MGPIEPDPAGRELVNRQAGGTVIPVQAQVVRRNRVEHDQKHVRRTGRRKWPRSIAPFAESVSSQGRRADDNQKEHGQGQAVPNESTEAGAMPLQERHQSRRDAQDDNQPGQTIDLGKGYQEDRQQGQCAKEAGREPTSAPGAKRAESAKAPPSAPKITRSTSGISHTK